MQRTLLHEIAPMPRPRKQKSPSEGEGSGTADTPRPKTAKTTTNIDPALLRKARHVATHRDKDIFEYLDSLLRPAIERDYEDFIRHEHESK